MKFTAGRIAAGSVPVAGCRPPAPVAGRGNATINSLFPPRRRSWYYPWLNRFPPFARDNAGIHEADNRHKTVRAPAWDPAFLLLPDAAPRRTVLFVPKTVT